MQLVLGQKFCAALIRWPLYFPNSMVSLSLHARAQMVGVAHNGQPRPQRLRHRGSSRCARAAWTASTQSAVLRKYVRRGGFPQSVSGWHSVCRTTAYHDEIGRNKFLRRAYRSESTQRRPAQGASLRLGTHRLDCGQPRRRAGRTEKQSHPLHRGASDLHPWHQNRLRPSAAGSAGGTDPARSIEQAARLKNQRGARSIHKQTATRDRGALRAAPRRPLCEK